MDRTSNFFFDAASQPINGRVGKLLRESYRCAYLVETARNCSYELNESDHRYQNLDRCDSPALPMSNEQRLSSDLNASRLILEDMVAIGGRLCSNAAYGSSSSEDSINDYLRDQLDAMGYEVSDQTRHGKSESGIGAGEIDLLIKKSGKERALVEALKLRCVDSSKIKQHIKKALENYNPIGTPTFIIAYASASSFSSFWNSFFKCAEVFISDEYEQSVLKEEAQPNASTKIASTIVCREGYELPVFFVAFNI